jgi:hypothetical protein
MSRALGTPPVTLPTGGSRTTRSVMGILSGLLKVSIAKRVWHAFKNRGSSTA